MSVVETAGPTTRPHPPGDLVVFHDAGLAWAGSVWGSEVVDAVALPGASTSAVLRLTGADGRRGVLRLVTREPWRTHGAELVAREADTMRALAATAVPAPTSLATDPSGAAAGHPAHLVTLLDGVPLDRAPGDAEVTALAETLASIHAVRPDPWPRTYQPWAWEAKYVVPGWAGEPGVWRAAFALLREPPPAWEPTFLHRDFAVRNLLWTGAAVSGVVDWVETSTGPAWLDVAHGATNLALDHGEEVAERFAAAYVARTGRVPQPWWDVLDVVGFLPRPGGAPFTDDPARLGRLEQRLRTVLARC